MDEQAPTPNPLSTPRAGLDLILDIAVFAPLGFALEAQRVVPELAAAGRRQLAFSQSLGRAALKTLRASSAPNRPAGVPKPHNSERTGMVDGYDEMTARDIVNLSRTATPAELTWMAEAEAAGKQRSTVLAALSRAARTT